MADQYGKETMSALQERWQSDEELERDDGIFRVVESPCASCQFAKEGTAEECQVYSPLPWDILTGELECPDYRKRSEADTADYAAVGDKDEILSYSFLPDEVLRQVRNREALAVWAYKEGTPASCAVFTQKDIGDQTAVVLQYICTGEAYRNQGLTVKLMEYAKELFAQLDIVTVLAFSRGEEPDSETKRVQDQFLTALGFEEYIKQYQAIEYSYSVLNTDKLQPFLKDRDSRICSLDTLTRRKLLQINQNIERRLMYYFSDDTVSPDSLAYVENGVISGAVILDSREDYQLCIRYMYMNPKVSDKTVLVKLLAAVTAKQKERKEKGNILIFAPEDRIARLAEYFFGEPYKRYYRTMYMMQ